MPRPEPILAVLVSSWYPSVDDPGLGRFVADQADALSASGRVRPLVASFDVAYTRGRLDVRRVDAVTAYLRHALTGRTDAVSPAGWSLSAGAGVARLPVPEPTGRDSLPAGEEADHRRAALEILADRLDTGGRTGVVHAHTAYPDGYAAIGMAERLGWPLVITEHASYVGRILRQPQQRRRYLEAAGAASRFIAVSDMLATELTAAIPEIRDKVVVVPNVVALDEFEAAPPDERTADELIFVGDRKERKGLVVLLRAFADVLERRPTATLRLIGKSPTPAEEERWQRLASDFDMAHAVRFEGIADRTAVARALSRASVFVHPSPRETFALVTLEALASGIPVVGTDSGGVNGILSDDRLGALVPPHDSRTLALAILRTLERRDDFDPGVLRAAAARFSGEKVVPRLVAVYEEALADAPPRQRPLTGTVTWDGRAEPLDEAVVVAHDPGRAARVLEQLPPGILERLTLVTIGDEVPPGLPPGLGRVVATGEYLGEELTRLGLRGGRGLRDRVRRLAADPLAAIRRRLVKGGLPELRWRAQAEATRRALSEIAGAARARGSHLEVVCLDVTDYAVTLPLVASGEVRPAPGGPLWLADRWASVQAGEERSARRAAVASASPRS